VTWEVAVGNGNFAPIGTYDPNTVNGGGDYNQGEAAGNLCIEFGNGTAYPLPANVYGSNEIVRLRFRVNNTYPQGNARTPGYWKNWNTCTGGKQAQTAAKNGGSAAGYWLLDNHLPHTMWTTSWQGACTSFPTFTLTNCADAVRILSTQDISSGKNKANDAAYNLAKHLLAYQLNIKSGTAVCASTAQAASQAQALLASICFNGRGDYLGPKVTGSKVQLRTKALDLAKKLDAYNNNLPCPSALPVLSTLPSELTFNKVLPEGQTGNELKVSSAPNPYHDRIQFVIESPVSGRGLLEVYNLLGQKVGIVFQGHVFAGKAQTVFYNVPPSLRTTLMYQLRVGNMRVTGKLLNGK
jgi:hypothetical protein